MVVDSWKWFFEQFQVFITVHSHCIGDVSGPAEWSFEISAIWLNSAILANFLLIFHPKNLQSPLKLLKNHPIHFNFLTTSWPNWLPCEMRSVCLLPTDNIISWIGRLWQRVLISWLFIILGIWIGSGSSLSWKRSQRPLVFSGDVHWSIPDRPHHYIHFNYI